MRGRSQDTAVICCPCEKAACGEGYENAMSDAGQKSGLTLYRDELARREKKSEEGLWRV